MYLSLAWLKDFVDIPRSVKPAELGLRLTMHTVEIDSVQAEADKYRNVIVAKILEIKKHPNADKLQLVKVKTGKEQFEVVCGAVNIQVGQKVPLALVGAILPNGLEIKETEIRGIKSVGMLCAADELGLGEDHAGIFILDDKAKVGQSLADYLKLSDVIFEVDNKSITNRPDLWGHYGLAREIAAFLRKDLAPYKTVDLNALAANVNAKLDIKIKNYKLCPRYMAVALDGIKIGPSPHWLEKRLVAVGMRPINNIVDATNYVMLELGQPLHAFDQSKVKNIIVRPATRGEVFVTLDGEKRELNEEMIVIADNDKAIAIAGVMGGANSEISSETTSIILESANFNPIAIRKASQKLNLRTEASVRFEKSLDPNLSALALAKAVDLIKQLCPDAKIASQVADEKDEASWGLTTAPIELDLHWLHKFMGEHIREKKIIEILTSLGFVVTKKEKSLSVQIPSWRATKDISIKEDLAEEIARIFGYDNLQAVMPKMEIWPPEINQEKVIINKIKNLLAGAPALNEVYNYSFVGEDQLKKLGIDYANYIHLVNPIASHQTMLRQSLTPNLLNAVKVNQARYEQFGLFEIGNVYTAIGGDLSKGDGSGEMLPYQEKRLAISLAGLAADNQFSVTQGVIEYLFAYFNLPVVFSPIETIPNWAEPKMAAKIDTHDLTVGFIYQVNQEAARRLGLKKSTVIAEISLQELFKLLFKQSAVKFQEFEKYPPAIRDLAFVVNEKILYNDIRNEILSFHPFIKQVELFDVYQGEKLGAGNKNLAFRIVYQADKTLTAPEVDEVQTGLIKRMEAKFEAKIRNF